MLRTPPPAYILSSLRDLFFQLVALGIGAASFWSAAEKDIAESSTALPERPKKTKDKRLRTKGFLVGVRNYPKIPKFLISLVPQILSS